MVGGGEFGRSSIVGWLEIESDFGRESCLVSWVVGWLVKGRVSEKVVGWLVG